MTTETPTDSTRPATTHTFRTSDGAELFYRAWAPLTPSKKALVLFHRGGKDGAAASASEDPRVPEEDRAWLLDEIRTLCGERGIRLVVVVPWYIAFEKHVPLLRDFASSRGVAIVDLPATLTGLPKRFGYVAPRPFILGIEVQRPPERGDGLIIPTGLPHGLAAVCPGPVVLRVESQGLIKG